MKHFFLYLFAGLSLFACADSAGQAEVPVAGEPVDMRIHLGVASMQAAESNAETRAKIDKLPAEQTIHRAWLLQFNGTAGTSTLVAAPQKLTMDDAGNTDVALRAGSGTHRVYIIANVDEATVNSLAMGNTLTAFETRVFPCSAMTVETMASQGLPMSAYKDIDMSTGLANQSFELISRMARVVFRWTLPTHLGDVAAITVKNLPSGMIYKPDVAIGSNSQQLSGVYYIGWLDIPITSGNPVVFYVPENLAGVNAAITKDTDRHLWNVFSKNGSYIQFDTGKEVSNVIRLTSHDLALGTDLAANVGDLNVKGNYAYQVSLDVKGGDTTGDGRVNTIEYKNLSVDADGKPATANCYVINCNDREEPCFYYIDATVMGNGATTPAHTASSIEGDQNFPAITPVALSPVSAKVLWETVNEFGIPPNGSIIGESMLFKGKLLFVGGTSKYPGNGVIAVCDAWGDILWSWHIWVTRDHPKAIPLNPITDDDGFTVSGMQLMDRNLGALFETRTDGTFALTENVGLFYQWGRKDPFPAPTSEKGFSGTSRIEDWSDADHQKAGGSSITPADAVKNPTVFYTNYTENSSGDWTTRNDNLWGTPLTEVMTVTVDGNANRFNKNSGSKTIYDPCPIGWRVPPAYTFAKATENNSVWSSCGMNFYKDATSVFSSDTYIMVQGVRVSDGTLVEVESSGAYWASSPDQIVGYGGTNLVAFVIDAVRLQIVRERSWGQPIRCFRD